MKRKRSESRVGAVVVEAAIMLPLFITVTFLSIDLSQYINSGQEVANASREGARAAARNTNKTVADVESSVLDYLARVMPYADAQSIREATQVTVKEVRRSGESTSYISVEDGDLTKIESGNPISVKVTFDFSCVRWIHGPSYPTHTIQTICRRD